jgi:hypothetical protein
VASCATRLVAVHFRAPCEIRLCWNFFSAKVCSFWCESAAPSCGGQINGSNCVNRTGGTFPRGSVQIRKVRNWSRLLPPPLSDTLGKRASCNHQRHFRSQRFIVKVSHGTRCYCHKKLTSTSEICSNGPTTPRDRKQSRPTRSYSCKSLFPLSRKHRTRC